MSVGDIYRQGGGKVESPPAWLVDAAEAALAAQRVDHSRRWIKIERPLEQLRVDPHDPEAQVRVHFCDNPDFVPPGPEAA